MCSVPPILVPACAYWITYPPPPRTYVEPYDARHLIILSGWKVVLVPYSNDCMYTALCTLVFDNALLWILHELVICLQNHRLVRHGDYVACRSVFGPDGRRGVDRIERYCSSPSSRILKASVPRWLNIGRRFRATILKPEELLVANKTCRRCVNLDKNMSRDFQRSINEWSSSGIVAECRDRVSCDSLLLGVVNKSLGRMDK